MIVKLVMAVNIHIRIWKMEFEMLCRGKYLKVK